MNTNSYYEYFTEFFAKKYEENPGRFWENYNSDVETLSNGTSLSDASFNDEALETVRLYFHVKKSDALKLKTGKAVLRPGKISTTVRKTKMLRVLRNYMDDLRRHEYRSKTLEGFRYDNHIFPIEAIFLRELLGVLEIFRRFIIDTNSRAYSRRIKAPAMAKARENEFVLRTIRCLVKCLHEFMIFAQAFKEDLKATTRQYEQNEAKCIIRDELQNVKVNRETILLMLVGDLKEHVIESE